MDSARQQIFTNYISHLFGTGKSFDRIGREVCAVQKFLENATTVDRRGYRLYMQEYAIEISQNIEQKKAICEFMAYAGFGFNGRKKRKTYRPLEKLSVVSAQNQELINKFMSYLMNEEDYSQNTLSMYSFAVKKYFEYANTISAENYKRFVAMLEERGLSPKTIRLRITAIERLSEFVGKPIKLRRPKIQKCLNTENVPTIAEYNRLIDYLKNRKNRDHYFFIRILATTGARISEFLKITWEDILAGEVTMKGKGNKYRRLFFNKGLQEEVRQYVKATGKTGPVAVNRFGTTITSRGISELMKSWGEKCGIDRTKMHPHAFRHFFAKMFLKSNKDIVQLADLLGHGSVDTTRIYLQKSYEEQKREFNQHVTW